MSDTIEVSRDEFKQLLDRVDALVQEKAELKERVTELESDRDDHKRRMDAYGKSIEAVNDDIADIDDHLRTLHPGGDACRNHAAGRLDAH